MATWNTAAAVRAKLQKVLDDIVNFGEGIYHCGGSTWFQ